MIHFNNIPWDAELPTEEGKYLVDFGGYLSIIHVRLYPAEIYAGVEFPAHLGVIEWRGRPIVNARYCRILVDN